MPKARCDDTNAPDRPQAYGSQAFDGFSTRFKLIETSGHAGALGVCSCDLLVQSSSGMEGGSVRQIVDERAATDEAIRRARQNAK